MVKAAGGPPAPGTVTGGAVQHLFIAVHIVCLVTVTAIGSQRLFQGTPVALQAGELCMGAVQRPAAGVPVVKFVNAPLPGIVATGAFPTMTATVNIRIIMAGGAFSVQRFGFISAMVANLTGLLGMGPGETKIGLGIVVKTSLSPAIFGVATVAAITELPVVDILHTMATGAHRGLEAVALPGVATGTRHIQVFSAQCKICGGMIKIPTRAPTLRGVAGATVFPEAALVWLLLIVACLTCPRRIPVGFPVVATVTGEPGMFPGKGKISLAVVKGIRVQRCTVKLPALVVPVAALALSFPGVRGKPVVAAAAVHVRLDFLMALEAEGALRGFVEAGVAGLTIALIFSMSRDERSRHEDHRLQINLLP